VLWMRGPLRQWADESRCVVVASHALAEVERTADDVVMIEDGRIVAAGAVAEGRGPHTALVAALAAPVPRGARGQPGAGRARSGRCGGRSPPRRSPWAGRRALSSG